MPIASHTQQFIPTQPTLVATSLPGTNATRPAFDAVAPSVSNTGITPDNKGTGSYTAVLAPAQTPVSPMLLSTPMPGSFGTSMASLNASTMFAAQSLAQDVGSAPALFEQYEELVAASEVKYKPSNATLPEPEIKSVFAKILEQDKTVTTRLATQDMAPAAQSHASAQALKPAVTASMRSEKPVTPEKSAPRAGDVMVAFSAYRATSARNETLEKEIPEAEAV